MGRHACLLALLLLIGFSGAARAQEGPVYVPTPEAARLFDQASDRASFWPLISAFVSEKYESYCGIASSVMALNVLRIPAPATPDWYPYRYWNEDSIFTAEVLAVKPAMAVLAHGLTLDELAGVLRASGARVERVFAGDTTVAAFRAAARAVLQQTDAVLLVDVSREALGQVGGGHISPLAAYNPEADRFLFLDVARYKYPPSWLSAERLFAAMNTTDPASGKTRGYVIVRK